MRAIRVLCALALALAGGIAGGCGGSARPSDAFALGERCVRAPAGCSVLVLGQVQRPGKLAYRPGTTVLDALRAAGGFTAFADRNHVTVVRAGTRFWVRPVDVARGFAEDVALRPGDLVVVPERLALLSTSDPAP